MGIISQPVTTVGAARLCAVAQKYGRVMSIDRVRDIKRIESCKLPVESNRDVTLKDQKVFKHNADDILKNLVRTGSLLVKDKDKNK